MRRNRKWDPDEAYETARERRLEQEGERQAEEAERAAEEGARREAEEEQDPIRDFGDDECNIPDRFSDNGPTGHGDICYSDADPGL